MVFSRIGCLSSEQTGKLLATPAGCLIISSADDSGPPVTPASFGVKRRPYVLAKADAVLTLLQQ
jgi:hypothetical protein